MTDTKALFLVTQRDAELLDQLASDWGYPDGFSLIEAVHTDSIVPGICTAEGCGYSTEVEPDSNSGWCEMCGTNTVVAATVLAAII